MIALTEIYKYVEDELPRCPEPLILRAMTTVVRDFCERSLIWKNDADDVVKINVRSGVSTYDVDTPYNYAEIVHFLKVERRYADDEDLVELSAVAQYERPSDCEIKLVVEPDADVHDGLEITVALRPTETAEKIPDCLFRDWIQTFAAGVKAQMMKKKGKPYYDPALAPFYLSEYDAGVARATIRRTRGRMLTPLQAKAKWQFA